MNVTNVIGGCIKTEGGRGGEVNSLSRIHFLLHFAITIFILYYYITQTIDNGFRFRSGSFAESQPPPFCINYTSFLHKMAGAIRSGVCSSSLNSMGEQVFLCDLLLLSSHTL